MEENNFIDNFIFFSNISGSSSGMIKINFETADRIFYIKTNEYGEYYFYVNKDEERAFYFHNDCGPAIKYFDYLAADEYFLNGNQFSSKEDWFNKLTKEQQLKYLFSMGE